VAGGVGCRVAVRLSASVACWATWESREELVGRPRGAFRAGILATSSQWALIHAQAMTDMAFVTPMTVALFAGGIGAASARRRAREGMFRA